MNCSSSTRHATSGETLEPLPDGSLRTCPNGQSLSSRSATHRGASAQAVSCDGDMNSSAIAVRLRPAAWTSPGAYDSARTLAPLGAALACRVRSVLGTVRPLLRTTCGPQASAF